MLLQDICPTTVRCTTLPEPPKCVKHPELTGPGAYQRLFRRGGTPSSDAAPQSGTAEEITLFKRMHYYAYRMNAMRNRSTSMSRVHRKRYMNWYSQYVRIRNRLLMENCGLVFALLGNTRYQAADRDELRSEGLMSLLRAVSSFNPWRGFKFSTYACTAVLNAFARVARRQQRDARSRALGDDALFEPPAERQESMQDERAAFLADRLHQALDRTRPLMTANEQLILEQRFPMQAGANAKTLQEVGRALDLSKERVRQIQIAALSKLRRILADDPLLTAELPGWN